jgi:hypothetical protein
MDHTIKVKCTKNYEMGLVFITIKLVTFMPDNGRMIYLMVMALTYSVLENDSRVN